MKGISLFKNIKMKLFVMMTFVALMFFQIGPYLLYADEEDQVFSYTRQSKIGTNAYYGFRVSFAEARIGNEVGYCVDYGNALPATSGGTVKYMGTLSPLTTAALANGYPNVTPSSLGFGSNDDPTAIAEATLATQFAVWTVAQSAGDSVKSPYIFDMKNIVSVENFNDLDKVKNAAKKIVERATLTAYAVNPDVTFDTSAQKIKVSGDKIIAGPYVIKGTGFNVESITVTLKDSPASAYLCDANGNAKTQFANGDSVYVALNVEDNNKAVNVYLKADGSHQIAKLYGTKVDGDGKQNYTYLANVPGDSDEYTLTIQIPQITGNIKVVKVDQYEAPLQGVVFELKDSAGKSISTQTTDANGNIMFNNLPIGKYTLEEKNSLPGYVLTQPNESIDVVYNTTTEVKVVNRKIEGGLKIIKEGTDGVRIANVTFKIFDEDKKVVDTLVTNKEGIAVTKKLPVGKYFFQEQSGCGEPDYIKVDPTMYPFEITDPGILLEQTFVNAYTKGHLTIHKIDEEGNVIEGVTFKIFDKDKNYVETVVTDANGNATTSELEDGTYYYQEIAVPSNKYVINSDLKRVEMKYYDKTEEVKNDLAKGKLKVIKKDELNKPIENVVFDILDADGNVVDTLKTDKNGIDESIELKLGTYYYQEKSAPKGVIIDDDKYEFILNEDEQIAEVELENELERGELNIYKVDEDGNYLKDISFTLMDEEGIVIATMKTDETGFARFPNLLPGKYSFKEVNVPAQYVDTQKVTTIEITVDQLKVDVDVKNIFKKGQLKVIKKDELNKPIENVVFDILDDNGNVVDTITTDANGIALSKKLRLGKYYYQEKSAPKGVIVDDDKYEFILNEDKQIAEVEVENELERGELNIFKVDEEGNYLKNVTFTLVDETGKEIAKQTTGEDGLAKFTDLLPGKYSFKEVDAPAYVVKSDEVQTIEITVDKLKVDVTVENFFKKGCLKIVKVDELNNTIEGVTFNILDENKNVIEEITTDKDGIAFSKKLKMGKYYYQEKSAPKGVIVDDEMYEFNITDEEQIVEVEVENDLERGELSIYKVDEEGNYLENVTFTLVDETGKEIAKQTTGKDGLAKFTDLLPGKYNFKEVDAPVSVVKNEKPQPIEITVDKLKVDVTVKNDFAKGNLRIHKMDYANNNLQGVVFELLDANKNVIETLTTDKNGMTQSKDLKVGKYYYREVSAADPNVIIDKEIKEFKITENDQIVLKEIYNVTVSGVVQIVKVDSKNVKKVLQGAEIEVLDANKNVIATLTTDEDGMAKLGNLKVGKYYYRETKAPEGYVLNSAEHEFNISQECEIVKETLKNDEKELPKTGGAFSTDMLIVTLVTVISVAGYAVFTLLRKPEEN